MHIAKELQKLLTKNADTCMIITRGADSVILASSKIDKSEKFCIFFVV
jgi:hypothetical protein